MSDIYRWYDPHPGLMGCPVRLPENLRLLAATIAGNKSASQNVLEKVQRALCEGFSAELRGSGDDIMVIVTQGQLPGPQNAWRLIKGRKVIDGRPIPQRNRNRKPEAQATA